MDNEQEQSVQELYNQLDNTQPTPNEDNKTLSLKEHEPVVDEGVEIVDEPLVTELELDNNEVKESEKEPETPEVEVKGEKETEAPKVEESGGIDVAALEKAKEQWLETQKPAINTDELDRFVVDLVKQPAQTDGPTINLDETVRILTDKYGEEQALAFAEGIKQIAPQFQQAIEHTSNQQVQNANYSSTQKQQYLGACQNKFYEGFPELKDHKDLVALVEGQVIRENPNALLHQLLNSIGTRTQTAVNQIKESAGVVRSNPEAKSKVDKLGTTPVRSHLESIKEHETQRLSTSEAHLMDLANFVNR